jgi:hypothetical protein
MTGSGQNGKAQKEQMSSGLPLLRIRLTQNTKSAPSLGPP